MASRCFAYGSLMCADIMARVCGRTMPAGDALLPGHARHPVRGEDYPAIVADPAREVAGRLYSGIAAAEWERLDGFEGNQYQRVLLQVRVDGGATVDAWAYLFRPQYHSLLLPGEWDFAAFLRDGRHRFEARYLGFRQIPP
ncbi:MAG: gamma-glutamylcyclotransferase [Rhodocyclaceae bacterium]|nr:gamma-glutamylcyclotransferase [Rhodocyclaceae bacterium]